MGVLGGDATPSARPGPGPSIVEGGRGAGQSRTRPENGIRGGPTALGVPTTVRAHPRAPTNRESVPFDVGTTMRLCRARTACRARPATGVSDGVESLGPREAVRRSHGVSQGPQMHPASGRSGAGRQTAQPGADLAAVDPERRPGVSRSAAMRLELPPRADGAAAVDPVGRARTERRAAAATVAEPGPCVAVLARWWGSANRKRRPAAEPSAAPEVWCDPPCRRAGSTGSRASGRRSGPSRAPASHHGIRCDSGQPRDSSSPSRGPPSWARSRCCRRASACLRARQPWG
jgi:hypothetical protein